MDKGHEQMDDMGEFAMTHNFRTVNPYIPQGCDQQGRTEPGRIWPAEACSDYGLEENQSESADKWLWVFVVAAAILSYAIYTL